MCARGDEIRVARVCGDPNVPSLLAHPATLSQFVLILDHFREVFNVLDETF